MVNKPQRTVKTTQIGICPSGKLTNGYNRAPSVDCPKSPQKPIPAAKPITSPQRQIPRLLKQSYIIAENSPPTVITTNGNKNNNDIYQLTICKTNVNDDDLFDKAKCILNTNTSVTMKNSFNKLTNFA